jgi:hypothetical protein
MNPSDLPRMKFSMASLFTLSGMTARFIQNCYRKNEWQTRQVVALVVAVALMEQFQTRHLDK